MAGLCQECSGCCIVFSIEEINKAFGEQCKHIGKTLFGIGCQIYETRPDACRKYICLWLDSQRRIEVPSMPENMRPDITHCVLGWPWGTDRETLFVYPYPGHEDAWKKEPVASYLQMILSRGGKLVIVSGNRRIAVKGDIAFVGTEEEFAEILN